MATNRQGRHAWAALALLAAVLLPSLACRGRGRQAEARTLACPGCNVLLISIDTLRADHLGSYGYERDTSPNIDRLAAQSIVWTDVRSQAPTTAPSHLSLFSGLYVSEHKNRRRAVPVIAQMFRSAGYRTAAFVDGGQLRRSLGFDHGFEHFFDSGGRHVEGAQVGGGLAVINPRVIAWLRQHRKERFFLFLHTYDVHCPYTPPEPWRSRYTNGYVPRFEIEGKCGNRYFDHLGLGEPDFRHVAALYDGGIRYTDHMLQQVLDTVHQLGLDDHTTVALTSDHGESLGERHRIGHNEVYEVQLRVPLIVRIPRLEPRRLDGPAESIDILPTLLGITGLPRPPGIRGVDLEAWTHQAAPRRRFRMSETNNANGRVVRLDPRWSLVLLDGQPPRLYDLDADPAQVRDVAAGHPAVVRSLLVAYRDQKLPHGLAEDYKSGADAETLRQLEALGYVKDGD